MTNLEKEISKLKQRVEILQYYIEKNDSRFRDQMRKMNLSVIKRQNLDTKNLAVLQAELKNLELGNNPTPEEQERIKKLKAEIERLEQSGESGGNPNTQPRPDRP